ncbi:hypothetical protein HY628_01210 [Candidatus Uhrbacteria bacterium]|nr:hypothetical protein [Candidatus Uhrbacteria bacterium]
MSTVTFSLTAPRADPDLLSENVVHFFADQKGICFGLFHLSNTSASRTFLDGLKVRLQQWKRRPAPSPETLEANFERMAQTVNEAYGSFLEQAETDGEDITVVLGATSDQTLVVTSYGLARGTLIRADAPNTFHVFELLHGLPSAETEKTRGFGALISGELQTADTLGFAPLETVTALGEEVWKRNLATQSPSQARSGFFHLLTAKEQRGTILILRSIPSEKMSALESPLVSIETLRKTEHATARFLEGKTFTFRAALAKLIRAAANFPQWFAAVIRRRKKISFGQTTSSALRTAFLSLMGFFLSLLSALRHPLKFFKRPSLRPSTLREAGGRLSTKAIHRFNALPRLSKLLLIGLLTVGVIFTQSIFFLRYQRNREARAEAYEQTVAAIRKSQSEAEAMVIYHDEDAARAWLEETVSQIEALPQKTRRERSVADELRAKTLQALANLRHEIVVDQMIMIPVTRGTEKNFDDWLFLYDDPSGENPVTALAATESFSLLLRADGKMERLNDDGTSVPLELALKQPIKDIKFFGQRLYALVPDEKQIYRFRRSENQFGNASSWITAPTGEAGLREARSMAIDGAIYVLLPSEVMKFFTGTETAWKPYIDPALEDATKIFTAEELEGVYILESKNRRLVVLSKEGALLAQYLFPEGVNLRDFAVSEKEKRLSVLDGAEIKQIVLAHLSP